MDNKELIKRVLGREDGYYTDDYVENKFPKQYKLMEKIYNYLDKKEFSELYNMSNENHLDFFKMIKYFERDKKYYDDPMIAEIIKAEEYLKIKGYREFGDTIRSYYSLPTEKLKRFLNTFTKNYYDDIGYEDLDKVVVEVTKNYDLLVSTWQEDDEEVNEAVLIKTKKSLDMIKIMLMSVEMI